MTTARPFRLASIALAATVLVTACTSSRDEKTTTGPTSENGENTASARGVTADTIKIGFSYPDLESLAKGGIVKVDWGPVEEVIKVLVDDINKDGGVNGRKLQVSLAKYFPPSNEEQLAACTKLTEDDEAFAVLGGFIGDQNLCVAQQHSTILVSGYQGFDGTLVAKARAPWVTWLASDDRSLQALVKLLDDNGKLEGQTIGIYSQTAGGEPLVDLATEALQDAGYEVVDTAINDVPATDTQAFNAQEKLLGERLRDKNVDAVFVVGGTTPGANWDAVGFLPAMYLPTTSLVSTGAFTNPLGKFPFVGGVASTDDPDTNFNTPEMQRCRQVYEQATGKEIKTPTQENAERKSSGFTPLQNACTALKIFVEAAKAAGSNLTQQTWKKGLESLGKIELATSPIASFGPDKPDAQDTFQLMQHDPAWTTDSDEPEFISIGEQITFRG